MADLEGELAFRLDTEESREGNLFVLTIKDSCLNYSSTDTLKPAMKEIIQGALDRGRRNFVINMRSVGVVDSCGLSVLISLKKQIEQGEGRLALVGLNGMIQRLFGVTRLDKAFAAYETRESALQALQSQAT
ncbi:MAG TPA: STAS domain-containing protein [Planctomycetota bacterium]|nr:STAS domain-containing protein [Planctomycetota bacterium]